MAWRSERRSRRYRGTARLARTHHVGRSAGGDLLAARRCAERVERLADLGGQPGDVEPEHATQVRDRAVIDEPVRRDADDPHRRLAEGWIGKPSLLDQLEDATPEPTHHHALL